MTHSPPLVASHSYAEPGTTRQPERQPHLWATMRPAAPTGRSRLRATRTLESIDSEMPPSRASADGGRGNGPTPGLSVASGQGHLVRADVPSSIGVRPYQLFGNGRMRSSPDGSNLCAHPHGDGDVMYPRDTAQLEREGPVHR
jgi:hypothetical protein